jgi:hypothetical protein
VTWHAKPFNELIEMMEGSLFTFGISLSHQLDAKYNQSRKIAASSKDVPGAPRAGTHDAWPSVEL